MALVLQESHDNIGIITFNNYDRRNALSKAFITDILAALKNLLFEEIRVIIIRAHPGAKRLVGRPRHQRTGEAGAGPPGLL